MKNNLVSRYIFVYETKNKFVKNGRCSNYLITLCNTSQNNKNHCTLKTNSRINPV